MKKIRFISLIVLVLLFASYTLAAAIAIEPAYGTAVVDGNTNDPPWDEWVSGDFFAEMYRAADTGKKIEAKLYLRYDCSTGTMYALVLTVDDVLALVETDEAWIALYTRDNKVVKDTSGDDGTPPDFAWVGADGGFADGFEASFSFGRSEEALIIAHVNVDDGGSQTSETVGAEVKVVCNPAIDIEKSTNGEDADAPTGPGIHVGATVEWEYVVTNIGGVELNNVTVTDSMGVSVSCPKTTLLAGESMICTASGTAQGGQYENLGTVSGEPTCEDPSVQTVECPPVTDEDLSHYYGLPADFGDLPNTFGVTLGGASHTINQLFLGASVDPELDGQPTVDATGDDNDGNNDNDGVTRVGNWGTLTGHLEVFVTGGDGCIFGWLDYSDGASGDANGVFEVGETILFNYPVTSGLNVIPLSAFVNPLSAGDVNAQSTFARFRLFPLLDGAGCIYTGGHLELLTGNVEGGEVEDYAWPFNPDAVTLAGFSASSPRTPMLVLAALGLLTLVIFGVRTAWLRRREA